MNSWRDSISRPAWELVLEAARSLTARGLVEFTRAQLLDEVMRRDPSRLPQSLGPVIQGMTVNASGGPPSPCGTPLKRVGHGVYQLVERVPAERTPAVATPAERPTPAKPHEGLIDIVLVGCVKTKASTPAPARTLYQSSLFEKRRRYAETKARRWYILSAEHGLVHPDALVEPYDVALEDQGDDYRRAWAQWVMAKLKRVEGDLRGLTIEIHAGSAYAAPLLPLLRAAAADVSHPVSGLSLGEHLSWYDQLPRTRENERWTNWLTTMTIVDGPRRVSGFTYRWPELAETFEFAIELTVAVAGAHRHVRMGFGNRSAYGRFRRRMVVFVGAEPVAEAVAADDYPHSGMLVGLLKDADGRMIQPGEPLPDVYTGFPIVPFADEVTGPYARTGLAVRLHEDDIVAWVAFALTRIVLRTGLPSIPVGPASSQPPVHIPAQRSDSERAIVDALLRYGREHQQQRVGQDPQFTPHPEANRLLIDDPFAFLLGVIFDQAIPAERAWRAPYELKLRLGHLDPARMAAEPEAVRAAVAQPPALHRYVEITPAWLSAAAQRVVDEYGGNAGAIWADNPRAAELADRLRAFQGIGQKKSAMAVELLARDLGVPVRELAGSDIAYDVHVRRVFLRTRLAAYDDLDHIIEVARRLHPERPGELDFPAWLVGRRWCGPGSPNCSGCPLGHVCPKDIGRADGIYGS